jgi:hypothetical protein
VTTTRSTIAVAALIALIGLTSFASAARSQVGETHLGSVQHQNENTAEPEFTDPYDAGERRIAPPTYTPQEVIAETVEPTSIETSFVSPTETSTAAPTPSETPTASPTETDTPTSTSTRTPIPTPSRTTTPTPTPTRTATRTPSPTLTASATHTPQPTATPEPSHPTFAEIVETRNSPALTGAQKNAYLDGLKGKSFQHWHGRVEDISSFLGSYSVWVDMLDGDRTGDVTWGIRREDALNYRKGELIRFSGTVDNFNGFLGFWVKVKNVVPEWQATVTPTATPTMPPPTPTPSATSTPAPAPSLSDIWAAYGNDQLTAPARQAYANSLVGRPLSDWEGLVCRIIESAQTFVVVDMPGGYVCEDVQFQIAAGDAGRFHQGQSVALSGRIAGVKAYSVGLTLSLTEVAWHLGPVPTPTPTLTPSLTPTASRTPVPTFTPTPIPPAVVPDTVNVRKGPGTNYDAMGSVPAGSKVSLVARNADGTWYRRREGGWIRGDLLQQVPRDLPVDYDYLPPPTVVPTGTTAARSAPAVAVAQSPGPQPVRTSAPVYPSACYQTFKPNTVTRGESQLYECFGTGTSPLRTISPSTPVQALGRGNFLPSGSDAEKLGHGPYLKIRVWSGQWAWIRADNIAIDLNSLPEVSPQCEVCERITFPPTAVPPPSPPPDTDRGGTRGPDGVSPGPFCCRVCSNSQACGNGCIPWSHTCRQWPGCACQG